jgi:hypothetical protein
VAEIVQITIWGLSSSIFRHRTRERAHVNGMAGGRGGGGGGGDVGGRVRRGRNAPLGLLVPTHRQARRQAANCMMMGVARRARPEAARATRSGTAV